MPAKKKESSEKKKILFVITKGNFGGAQRYVYDLATHLPASSYDVVVACGDQDGDTLKNKLMNVGIRTLTLEGSGREIKATSDFGVFRQLIHIIQTEQPHVVHLNSSKIGGLGVAAGIYIKIKKLFKKEVRVPKIIFTTHGWAFNEKNRSGLWKLFYYISYYITVIGAHRTIAVSHTTKRGISNLPFLKNKITVIHNGLDKFDTLPFEEARGLLKGDSRMLIASLGELHPSKGYDVALRGIARLPEFIKEKISYHIIGGGEQEKSLTALITSLNLQNTVTLLGPIDNAKKLLTGVDLFLLPSRNENLPYALLEAGLIGLPIIATSVGGIPEILNDMENGILVHKENPKEIAEGITYMIEHPEKQKEFSKHIHKKVAHDFSVKRMLEKTLELYNS